MYKRQIDMSRVELPMMFNLHHPLNLEVIGAEAQHDNMQSAASVSYTHLDVYKRQALGSSDTLKHCVSCEVL